MLSACFINLVADLLFDNAVLAFLLGQMLINTLFLFLNDIVLKTLMLYKFVIIIIVE